MNLVDCTLPSPEENLALDEALLDWCETGEGPETLRFWEPSQVFVVVGYGNAIDREVEVERCRQDGVPIRRRCSGGGTVVQMPGVLNFNVVVRIPEEGPLLTVTGTNAWVMNRMRDALAKLPGLGGQIAIRGISDLCFGERKFVGSAQRRKRAALVFHGSILLNANLDQIERYLRFPSKQPDYRGDRSHLDFCCNLGRSAADAKAAILEEWGVADSLTELPLAAAAVLVRDRYATREWNEKF